MHTTAETWQGIVSVYLTDDGEYTVRTSGKHGERSRTIVSGNVNKDEAFAHSLPDVSERELV